MKVVSDKEIRVALLTGHVVRFEPGVAKEVSDEVAIAAMQQGAKQVAESSTPVIDVIEVEFTPEDSDDIVDKLVTLIEEADPTKFKRDGSPRASVVNDLVGRVVSTEEREAAWEAALRK